MLPDDDTVSAGTVLRFGAEVPSVAGGTVVATDAGVSFAVEVDLVDLVNLYWVGFAEDAAEGGSTVVAFSNKSSPDRNTPLNLIVLYFKLFIINEHVKKILE